MQKFEIKKILIPIDFSDTSLIALDHAIYMAKLSHAEIVLIHMIERLLTNTNSAEFYAAVGQEHIEYEKAVINKGKEYLDSFAEDLRKKHGIKITASTIFGRTHAGIISAADELNADLIIMGTHGVSGFRELVMGSNTFKVVSETKCPVLSVQMHTKTPGFKKILLPFRAKAHSREKVNYAISLAKLYGSAIHVFGIDADGTSPADLHKIELEAAQIKRILDDEKIVSTVEVKTDQYLADMLLEKAKEIKADLIIDMADLDRMNISEYILGPVAQQIVNHSPIPVLSIRPMFNPDTVDLHGYGW